MTKINVSPEIKFQTTRSGGKGGQNVNKVETAVLGFFHVANSEIVTAEQKELVIQKLSNRINSEGYLLVKSQVHRSQLGNKDEVIKKMNELINHSLHRKKLRVATKPSKKAKEKRLEFKKKNAERKSLRKKLKPDE